MRKKLFTHTDLDGLGCAVLAKLAFNDVDVWFTDYGDVNADVAEFIATCIDDYSEVYITDMSINKELAELIDRQYSDKVTLLDHHGSVEWLNQYDWAYVAEKEDGKSVCGTSLFYDHLLFNFRIEESDALNKFVEAVRQYDVWEWKALNNDEPSKLNMLQRTLGKRKFLDRMVSNINFFTAEDLVLLDVIEDQKARYIKTALYTMKKRKVVIGDKTYTVGIMFAEDNISELGNSACEQNTDIDFCVIINMQQPSVSYRTVREDLDLGKDIAMLYGGGGHPKAAGSQVSSDKLDEIIDIILRRS